MQPSSDPDDLDDLLSDEEAIRLKAILEQSQPIQPQTAPPVPAPRPRGELPARPPAPAAGEAAAGGSAYYLKVIAGPNDGKKFRLPASGTVRVGRAPDVEIQLDDNRVSRYHFRIQVDARQLTIADLNS
jgi:hypothetical protein